MKLINIKNFNSQLKLHDFQLVPIAQTEYESKVIILRLVTHFKYLLSVSLISEIINLLV